jgi:hypothetical protein
MRIGIDFDNTIARYDELFQSLAGEAGTFGSKQEIRDHLRRQPNGEESWRDLQAEAYGPRMGEAEVYPGVVDFLRQCRAQEIPVYVVSHKTRFAANDKARVDLRVAALAWMEANNFFESDGIELRRENIFFEDTRAAKVSRIAALECSHFIDDLEEIFTEADFPNGVAKVLLSEKPRAADGRFHACCNWREITSHVFGD